MDLPNCTKGQKMTFKIEHEGGDSYFVYRRYWFLWVFPDWDLIGVEYTAEAAERRVREASQYPKYMEV